MNKEYSFSLITPKGTIFNDLVTKLIVTTTQGEITILKGHIPLIATTKKGRLVIFKSNGNEEYVVEEGVLRINKQSVMLLSLNALKK